jgi:transcriptional regulator with XRE-family HTH domain
MGGKVKQLREEAGLSIREAADLVGMSPGAIQYWEREDRVPEEHRQKYAGVLEVDPDALDSAPSGRLLSTKGQINRWRDIVQLTRSHGLTHSEKYILVSLPLLYDEELGAVHCTIDQLAEEIHEDPEFIREHWDEVIDSPFVERVGSVEWLLRLKFP